MECPHCQKELPALPCASCGQPVLPEAKYCHHCGLALPAPGGEPPKQIACASCGRPALPDASYCPGCGDPLHAHAGEDAGSFDPNERQACSDGLCVGIIGADGNCTVCGKPYQPEGGE
jgi:hypothetical protein